MSIWKSPVFYFGIMLAVVVTAALAAPFVVDWNAYRADLESYGKKLTGREVTIEGPVAVRLFPWPRLEANAVSLSNPQGQPGNLLSADRVIFRINLAGLVSGTLQVEEIQLQAPVVTLARDASGSVNWKFEPLLNLRSSALLQDVKLDKISLHDGRLVLADAGKAVAAELTGISADLSAPSIAGPWRTRGEFQYAGLPVAFTLNSNEMKAGQPLNFGLHLSPSNASYPDVSFDGGLRSESGIKGYLRLSPHAAVNAKDAKGNQEGEFRPLSMQAELEANFDQASLKSIKITPADVRDSSTLIEGETTLDYRNGLTARSALRAPRLNLDTLLGAQSLEAWRVGGFAGFLNTVMQNFPKRLALDLQFDASVLTLAGQALDTVSLAIDAQQNAVRVRRFAANLPGQSKVLFNGIVFPGESEAELGGTLALESPDLRSFVQWVWPAASSQIADQWVGNRGHLKLQTDVSLTGQRLGLQNLKYELDGFAGSAQVFYRLRGLPSLDMQVNSTTLNLDGYLKNRITALPSASGLSWAAVIGALTQGGDEIEKRLNLQAGTVMLNGVQANDLTIDVTSGLSGLDIKAIDIGSVAGARLTVAGQILNGTNGPLGEVSANVVAADPIGMLKLMGLAPAANRPPWTQALAETDVSLKVLVSEGANAPQLKFSLEGSSGPFAVSGSGTVEDVAKGAQARISVDAMASAAKGAELVRAAGIPVNDAVSGPAHLSFKGDGNFANGLRGRMSASALGVQVEFEGTLGIPASYDGTVKISAADVQPALRALGVPLLQQTAAPLQLTAKANSSAPLMNLSRISGKMAGAAFSGDVKVSEDDAIADFELEMLNLGDVLAASFLSWQGRAASADTPFSLARPFGLNGEVWIRPRRLMIYGNVEAAEAVVGLTFDANARRLYMAGTTAGSEKLALDVALAPKAGFFELQSSGTLPVSLEEYMTSSDLGPQISGRAALAWKGSGTGLTPFAALSDFAGSGTMTSPRLALVRIAPQVFITAIPQVKTSEDLTRAISQFESSAGFDLGTAVLPFAVTSGVVKANTLSRALNGGTLSVDLSADLASREMTAISKVEFPAASALPSASVVLTGPPAEMTRRSLTSELASKLGYDILARDLAELERVQKQQQELIAKEERQREYDQAKFEAYQAQKAEIRLRVRELKVFAAQRARDQAAAKLALDKLLAGAAESTAAELARRHRELEVFANMRHPVNLPQGVDLPQSLPAALPLQPLQ